MTKLWAWWQIHSLKVKNEKNIFTISAFTLKMICSALSSSASSMSNLKITRVTSNISKLLVAEGQTCATSLSPSCVNEGIFDLTANDFNMSEGRYYVAQCKHIYSAKTQAASENILRLVWQTSLSVRNTPSLSENTQLPMRAKWICCNTKIVFFKTKEGKMKQQIRIPFVKIWYFIQTG